MVDGGTSTSKRTCLRKLESPEIREGIADIFSRYVDDVQDILTAATVESQGFRPDGITNEIFSCFHHVARGLCFDDVDASKEFGSARSSHLKRAILDSYKITINSYLTQDDKIRETMDYMVLVEDFSRYVPDGFEKKRNIDALSRKVKQSYNLAKQAEQRGNFVEAESHLNEALDHCVNLRDSIEVFIANRAYILACARQAKSERDKRKAWWYTLLIAIVSAAIGAIANAIANHYFPSKP